MLAPNPNQPPPPPGNPPTSRLDLSNLQSRASTPRRRGGQPGNSNARVHGFYAARPRAPSQTPDQERVDLFRSIPSPLSVGGKTHPSLLVPGSAPDSDLLRAQLDLNRLTLARILVITRGPISVPEFRAWVRQVMKISSINSTMVHEINRLQGYPGMLSSLACDVPWLVHREFERRGIPEHTLFVPLDLRNFDANSSTGGLVLSRRPAKSPQSPRRRKGELAISHRRAPGTNGVEGAAEGLVLTDTQWSLLGETLQTLREQLDTSRTYRRHKPGPNPRLLMEGILLKLAFAGSWRELPGLFHRFHPHAESPCAFRRGGLQTGDAPAFPLRAAQRLYRQLYLSGRMAGIYSQLGWHLAVYGGTTPEDLVEMGVFQLIPGRTLTEPGRRACPEPGRRVRLAPGQRLTWQKFTALLLLQRALFNQRASRRRQNLERRRRGNYLRLTSRRPKSPRRQSSPNIQSTGLQQPPFRQPSSSAPFTPAPAQEPRTPIQPLQASLAWMKWAAHEGAHQ